MRVTNHFVTRSISGRLQASQQRMMEAQERVTSGKRVSRVSDDPAAGAAIMQVSGSLRGIAQYTRNVERVRAQLDAEDSALGQVTLLMTRAKELGVATIGANVDGQGRRVASAEMRELFTQVVNVANTRVGDTYLFGGTSNDGRAPFTGPTTLPNGTTVYVPTDPPVAPATAPVPREPVGERLVEIAAGQTMRAAHDGRTVFLDSGVLAVLDTLASAMAADDTARMASAMTALESAFNDVQAAVGETGARQSQADTAAAGLTALGDTLIEQKADLSEVEMEAAITEMLQRQSAYQAAMLASSKVMGLSLVDYVR